MLPQPDLEKNKSLHVKLHEVELSICSLKLCHLSAFFYDVLHRFFLLFFFRKM